MNYGIVLAFNNNFLLICSGNISLQPDVSSSLVSGGILAGMICVYFWFAERNLFVYNYDPKSQGFPNQILLYSIFIMIIQ